MPIEIARTDNGDLTTLRITGTLDVNTAPEMGPMIDRLLEERRLHVVCDLQGLDLVDSSGVAVLVALYKRIRAIGGQVKMTNARDQPLAIFKLLRMDKVFLL